MTNNILIRNATIQKSLLIPYPFKELYSDCFDYRPHYNNIILNKEVMKEGVLVVMCLWKRLHYLDNTIQYLIDQNINKMINLCIWNNNIDEKDRINTIINKYDNSNKINIVINHSTENIGGIGRFVLTKYICETQYNFEHVIFIDDDQIFDNDCFDILLDKVKPDASYHWSGKKFYKDRGYWNCYSNIWPKLRDDINIENFDENYLEYGGTGFMIINTECFMMEHFYNFNEKYKFIEDLWMSYFVIKNLDYKLQNGREIKTKVRIIQGENESSVAQVNILKPLKDEFLNTLRNDGEWDV